jgi:predicted anti-sigma-YlaC factor YlaD
MEPCPPDRDETAEAFVLQRLTAEEMILFETHLMTCNDCRQAVQSAAEYIAAVRAAAKRLEQKQ